MSALAQTFADFGRPIVLSPWPYCPYTTTLWKAFEFLMESWMSRTTGNRTGHFLVKCAECVPSVGQNSVHVGLMTDVE